MGQNFKVTITEEQHVGLNADVFNDLANKVLEITSKNDIDSGVSLVLVDDVKIQNLNKTYRGIDKPTDVLSFPYEENDEDIGEIFISTDTAKSQAQEQSHELSTEIEILFVHGMLHVLGYDHENDKDRAEMTKLERSVLGEKSGLIQRNSVE